MSSDSDIQVDPYLSSKEAGKLLGYTHDYISKLCREGKMNGIQRGRVWFVTKEEVLAFQKRHEAELEQKKSQLSEKFSAIRMKHETVRKQDSAVVEPPDEIFSVSMPVSESVTPESYSESISLSAQESIDQKTNSPEDETIQTKIKFEIPRHFVAVGVLALALLVSSIFNDYTNGSRSVALVQSTSSSDFIEYFDAGVIAVIEAQSDLVTKTANTYSFIQYLSDGYWELWVSVGKLFQNFYAFLNTISESYLTVYLLQGEIVYDSLKSVSNMGAIVLQVYEIIGQSFMVGSRDVLNEFKNFFMVDSYVQTLKKN